MARVLLIKPPWHALQNLRHEEIPLGLCYVAAVLRTANHTCLVFDGDLGYGDSTKHETIITDYEYYLKALHIDHPIWTKTRRVVNEFEPDIVGITVMTAAYGAAMNVAEIVKKHDPNISVIVGGPHPSLLPQETLRERCIDVVVREEGEHTMLEVVKCLEEEGRLKKILGISYKEKGKIYHNPPRPLIEDLDSLSFPARDLIYEKAAYDPNSFGFIFTSRGCPYNCIFCSSHKIWGRRVRFRSAENVVAEINEIKRSFKTTFFRFNDDSFTVDKNRVFRICDLLVKEKLGIKWMCDTRVDLLSRNLLQKMKEAGCIQVNLGIESGNPKILKLIKKGITLEQARRAIKITKDVGVSSHAYFMMGFPGETYEQILDTINFMKKAKPTTSCLSIVTPYPGTELYDIAKQQGLLPRENWAAFFHHSKKMKLTDKLTDNQFYRLVSEIQKMSDAQIIPQDIKSALLHPWQFLYRKCVEDYPRHPKSIPRDFALITSLLHTKISDKVKFDRGSRDEQN